MSDAQWKMPEWMRPFEGYFNDRGALSVEASMNLYGAKCGNRLALADPDIHALIINAQVGMLVALQAAGLLTDGKPRPNEAQRLALERLAEKVNGKFDVPMAAWREESPCHKSLEWLRKEVEAIFRDPWAE